MNKLISQTLLFLTLLLAGCSGSDAYQGTWKALNEEGEKTEIIFEPKQMTIMDENDEAVSWSYSQNSVSFENSTHIYGIKLENGLTYSLVFQGDSEKGIIVDQNDNILFVIGRDKYYTYEDIYGLN